MTEDSYISYDAQGNARTFVGADATALFRAQSLRFSLDLYNKHRIMPTRGVSCRKMLDYATDITQKKYKRTQVEQAVIDLKVWCDNMKLALPSVTTS